jgi:hypothetical protein
MERSGSSSLESPASAGILESAIRASSASSNDAQRFRGKKAVREIIIGERMPAAYLAGLTTLVKKQFGQTPVRTARRASNLYTLIIE